ncbi:MAG: HIT domain-containing protein [Thaumarchaeota archaeon]|nr:HIT domain-containing protein [Nitrososphaerota archaeon]
MNCIFCKIVKKEIPAKIIFETEKSLAFMDAFPLTKGHSLVVTKTHYEKVQDISKEDNADLFETVRRTISKVDKITDSTLLAIHNGKQSGQEIPHVHVHLIPRSSEDSAGPVHSMFSKLPKLSDKEIQTIYEKLKDS